MKTLNLENSLLVDREGATIPVADSLFEPGSRLTTRRVPLMKQAKFRRLFDRHQGSHIK